jgi:hypothetical protein
MSTLVEQIDAQLRRDQNTTATLINPSVAVLEELIDCLNPLARAPDHTGTVTIYCPGDNGRGTDSGLEKLGKFQRARLQGLCQDSVTVHRTGTNESVAEWQDFLLVEDGGVLEKPLFDSRLQLSWTAPDQSSMSHLEEQLETCSRGVWTPRIASYSTILDAIRETFSAEVIHTIEQAMQKFHAVGQFPAFIDFLCVVAGKHGLPQKRLSNICEKCSITAASTISKTKNDLEREDIIESRHMRNSQQGRPGTRILLDPAVSGISVEKLAIQRLNSTSVSCYRDGK